MHPIQRFIVKSGRRILLKRILRALTIGLLALAVYMACYGGAILLIKSMSLTLAGLLVVPGLIILATLVSLPVLWWRMNDIRKVARILEEKYPQLQLSLRSSLDFLEGRADQAEEKIQAAYIEQVTQKTDLIYATDQSPIHWGRYTLAALALCMVPWGVFRDDVLNKYYNPSMSFGQTHLDLNQGSITIFEPEYTQIPGRTLPLKPGVFTAYPGSKVRFMVTLPNGAKSLHLAVGEGETEASDDSAKPLRITEEGVADHEFVLLKDTQLRFLLAENLLSGRTAPYQFKVKSDDAPEIDLRSHTPEGVINVMDPLLIEAEVKDDFGVKELVAVVTVGEESKRIPISVPAGRKKHFISKNQWFISDLELGKVDKFTIYLEAVDNNPINGPGVGRSSTLSYELESPEKKYDEFMEMAKQLLDTMTHALGDNLETDLPKRHTRQVIQEGEEMSKQIREGLYRALNLTSSLIGKVRSTPNLTTLDQSFLFEFRNGVSRQSRERNAMMALYASLSTNPDLPKGRDVGMYQKLVQRHGVEERGVEELTYELLLQLKMWAILELERQNNDLREDLDRLEELLNNAEDMDSQELQDMFDKLMAEIMEDFQEMMTKAAREMDMTMSEFMNSDAMNQAQDQMEDLREQIMEALKNGDMDKARELMEQLKQAMQQAFQEMQSQMGEMSPEMQAMMQNMRELQGLLRELKSGQEQVEQSTRELKREMDQQMGGNPADMDQQKQEEFRKATERIHQLLEGLYNKLVDFSAEDLTSDIANKITESRELLVQGNLEEEEARRVSRDISRLELLLDNLNRDGLDRLQTITLRNLSQTEKLQEYLDQSELMLSLESALKLESFLMSGERLAERIASPYINEKAKPKETFAEARQELYKIIDALQNIKEAMEQNRRDFMQSQNEQRQKDLAQQQAELQQMIEEFLKKTEESFGGSQLEQKLEDIGLAMKGAEGKLSNSKLEGGLQNEQDALQKIGEMMEQLQQAQRPGSPRPMPGGMGGMRQQPGNQGDPSLEDIYIPDSQKKASKDAVKDAVRRQLEKNLPESYGKEIRKYYEKLMDQ